MTPPRSPFAGRACRAFTLLELLVSMGVLAMLLVIMLSIVDSATRMWRQSENRVDSYREARAALNVIAADLAAICISDDTNHFRILGENAMEFLTAVSPDYQDGGSNSNVCHVGYTWKYARANPLQVNSSEGYNLFRSFRSSNDTVNNIKNGTPPQAGTEELLARNIVDFRIAAFTLNENGTRSPFQQSPDRPMPDVIEISLTALNNDVAQRFRTRSDWENPNSETRKQWERTFTTRVRINGSAVKSSAAPAL
jgi:prepilin-type N-terminal cleavage/methylation domain